MPGGTAMLEYDSGILYILHEYSIFTVQYIHVCNNYVTLHVCNNYVTLKTNRKYYIVIHGIKQAQLSSAVR